MTFLNLLLSHPPAFASIVLARQSSSSPAANLMNNSTSSGTTHNVSILVKRHSSFAGFNLTFLIDVSAAMCVLFILDVMDEERLSLLQEDVTDRKHKDCLNTGMELLHTASKSSSFASRLLAALQQLSRENAELRHTISQPSDITEDDNSRGVADLQTSLPPFGIDPLDPLWGINIDFGDFNEWLSGPEF